MNVNTIWLRIERDDENADYHLYIVLSDFSVIGTEP